MARITNDGMSGVIGNVVFYTMNGKKYARSLPNLTKKRRKELSQAPQATVFGLVSRFGTPMMRMLQDQLLFPFTLATYNAARGWMRGQYSANREERVWPLSGKYSSVCSLNVAATFPEALKDAIQITDTGKGKIKIVIDEMSPVKYIKAPAGTKTVNIKVVALSSAFNALDSVPACCIEQYTITYKKTVLPAQEMVLKKKSATGDIAVIVVALEFETDNGYSRDIKYLPAGIVAMGKLR